MKKFKDIYNKAAKRKGSSELNSLMPKVKTPAQLRKIGDDRYLATMTKCINQAGFSWKVIENKWPEFEQAFYNFNIVKLNHLSPEDWENYVNDRRIVRHWQKIDATRHNASFVHEAQEKYGSFAKFFADWPSSDQVGLMLHLKKHGARLGGNTGQYFLRRMGKDSFILSEDVVAALQHAGVEARDNPTSKRDLGNIQQAFNHWHEETGYPYSHLSKLLSYSIGNNYENTVIRDQMEKFN